MFSVVTFYRQTKRVYLLSYKHFDSYKKALKYLNDQRILYSLHIEEFEREGYLRFRRDSHCGIKELFIINWR